MEKEINYKKIIESYPWIVKKKQLAVLSPDTDGFLCGLLLSKYLDWKIVGFYDGKTLQIQKGTSVKDCIFLDMEILRPNVRSLGHHMNIHNTNQPPSNYHYVMKNCLNPNYLRNFDRAHYFAKKYPLGSIHFLLFILDNTYPGLVKIKKEGLGCIFFADGIWKILFKYTDNFLDWFRFLDIGEKSDWWKKLQNLSVIELIKEINELIDQLKILHPQHKRWFGHIDISNFEKEKVLLIRFLKLLGTLTGWDLILKRWEIQNLKRYKFTKKIYTGKRNNDAFLKIWKKRPISLAMTEGSTIQYTLEGPDTLP
jgi:hypothetical protein